MQLSHAEIVELTLALIYEAIEKPETDVTQWANKPMASLVTEVRLLREAREILTNELNALRILHNNLKQEKANDISRQ
jgi:hypothetical protein